MTTSYNSYLMLSGPSFITEGVSAPVSSYFLVQTPSVAANHIASVRLYFQGTASTSDWEWALSSNGIWSPGTSSLTLDFVAGDASRQVLIRAVQDQYFEGDETLIAYITNPITLLPSRMETLIIKDNFIEKFIEIKGTNNSDLFISTNSNEHFDGLSGLDSVKYTGSITNYETSKFFNGDRVVSYKPDSKNSTEIFGTDTITNIERLIFTDSAIAFDLDKNAGIVAKIVGAVFGKQAVSNKYYVGIGLSILDAGWTYDALAGLAIDAAGAKTNDQIVSLLWTNVIGTTPTAADKKPFIGLLENGMTQGALAHLAADTSFNTTNINLVGLALTGIEYMPVN